MPRLRSALADMAQPSVTPAAWISAAGRRHGYRPSPHPLSNRLARAAWGIVWLLLFRPTPRPMNGWRRWLLRRFGARIGDGATVHASVRIWAPWNLEMGAYSCLSPDVDCYCVERITIGDYATVSQYSFLCGATHDDGAPGMPLVSKPIRIGAHAWVAADVFVAPGVEIAEGAVVGARSSVFGNIPPWTVAVGSPARAARARKRGVLSDVQHVQKEG